MNYESVAIGTSSTVLKTATTDLLMTSSSLGWAAQDSAVAEVVRKVDRVRYEFLRSIFNELGFEGDDPDDRVHIFLVFECAQHTIHKLG